MLSRKLVIQCLVLTFTLAAGAESLRAQENPEVKRGKSLFGSRGCAACHAFGKKMAGPDLAGVTGRRSHDWLVKWLTQTDVMLSSDSTAKALLQEFKGIKMPKQTLSNEDANALIAYLDSEGNKKK
jgi:nitrite reductase (NO-forming)